MKNSTLLILLKRYNFCCRSLDAVCGRASKQTKRTYERKTNELYIYIYTKNVYVNALNRLHSVSQQFDRMSGMFTDYSSNVMLTVLYIVFLTMSLQTNQQLTYILYAMYAVKFCVRNHAI